MGVVSASQDSAMNNTVLTSSSGDAVHESLLGDSVDDSLQLSDDDLLSATMHDLSDKSTVQDIKDYFDGGNVHEGDTVYLGNKVYSSSWSPWDGNNIININIANIIISGGNSSNPDGFSTINANQAKVFSFNANGITLKNVKIVNSDGGNGPASAIYIDASGCTIENCVFDSCQSPQGGAIHVSSQGTNVKFTGCNFTNNVGKNSGSGGAAYIEASNCQFINCNFEKNSAAYGGAIQVASGGNLIIDGCNFTENTAQSWGYAGAINIVGDGETFTITNSKFKKNTGGSGGAIHAGRPSLTLVNCEFEENVNNNGNTGGGAVNIAHDNATIKNCNFTSNSAAKGGAIYIADDCHNADMSYCKFEDNTAASGKAIYADGSADGKVSNCDLGGFTDLSASNENLELTFTLSTDYAGIVVGNIEGAGGGSKAPIVGEDIKLEIFDSNGALVVGPITGVTDDNGQYKYDYSSIPLGDYTYKATYGEGDSELIKEGSLYNIVSGNKFSDIQAAIDAASDGDTLYLAGVTYVNDQSKRIIVNNKAITLIGIPGTVLDGENKSGIFQANANNVVLKDISFINGNDTQGGAIMGNYGTLTIDGCHFEDNHASQSGNDVNCNGNGNKIVNCTFKNSCDFAVMGGASSLTLTVQSDYSGSISGSIEQSNLTYWNGTAYTNDVPKFPMVYLADQNVALEIYENGAMVGSRITGVTDKNGEFKYDYSQLPFGDYTYKAYYLDADPVVQKEGNLYRIVSGNKFSDIQAAIDAASDGETIYLRGVTYTNDGVMTIDKSVSIIGVDGTVLDAEGKSRIFTIADNIHNVALDKIKFINGFTDENGGAIKIGENCANVLISNSNFTNNHVSNDSFMSPENAHGGAISIAGSSHNSIIVNTTFIGNTAPAGGGAIKNFGGQDWDVINSTFINNTAYGQMENNPSKVDNGGGAIWTCKAKMDIFNSTFIGNKAPYGGALRGFVDIYTGQFYYNVATNGNGGGIDVTIEHSVGWPSLEFINATFVNNTAKGLRSDDRAQGGALHMYYINHVDMINCKCYNNTADRGGAVDLYVIGTVVVDNCDILNNTAHSEGGGFYINTTSSPSDFYNSNITNNKAGTDGGAIYLITDGAFFDNITSLNNSAQRGGSAFLRGHDAVIQHSTFSNNTAIGDGITTGIGGALDILGNNCQLLNVTSKYNNASLGGSTFIRGNHTKIKQSTFDYNNATLRGGGINVAGDDCNVSDVDVSGNFAGTDGGAVYVKGHDAYFVDVYSFNNTASRGGSTFIEGDRIIVHNCTLDNNRAVFNGSAVSGRGGGLDIAGSNCQIYDLDVSDNYADGDGGAFYVKSDNLHFYDIISDNNTAARGGSSYIYGDNITVSDSEFNNNKAIFNGTEGTGLGGALDILGNNCTFYNVTSNGNNASLGGSTFIRGNNTVIRNCTLDNNNATLRGGAINVAGNNCNVTDVDVSGNIAGTDGGAVYVKGDYASFVNVESYNNTASRGGSTFIEGNFIDVHNCTLDGNKALFNGSNVSGRGGGLDIAGENCTIYDLDVSDNTADREGGAFYVKSSNIHFYDIQSINNTAQRGGSSFILGNNITVSNSTFDNNKAINNGTEGTGLGGALDVLGNDCKFFNVTSLNNNATRGGSTFIRGNNTYIKNCTLDNNYATERGGGLDIAGNNCTVIDVDLSNNRADGDGGAVYVRGNNATFDEVDSLNNTAARGGSSFIDGNDTRITNCDLDNNTATIRGGGLDVAGVNCTVINVTLSNCNATQDGGAVYVRGNNVLFDNVTSLNNTAQRGGSSFIQGNNITVQNCHLDNNKAFADGDNKTTGRAGGLDIAGNGCTIVNVTLSNNHGDYDGGAVYVKGNNTVFDNVTSVNNTAERGGSSFIEGNNITVKNSHLDNNTATIRGGGLDVAGNDCTFVNVTLSNCNATEDGGAVYVRGNNTVFDNVTSVNNTAQRGGSSFIDGNNITVKNSHLDNNTASLRGGGLDVAGNDCTFENVTLSNCKAGTDGGAVYVRGNHATFDNVTSVNNTALQGGSSYISGDYVVVQNSRFRNNTANKIEDDPESGNGGSIKIDGDNSKFLNNSISNNKANSGGGVFIEGENALFMNNNLTFNSVTGYNSAGGAVSLQGANANFTHNNISSNTASDNGGGMFIASENAYIEDLYAFNNTAENGGFAKIFYGENLIIKNSTFISNHAIGDIGRDRGEGGAFHLDWASNADIQANFYNNSATNGSAIYVQGSEDVRIHDSNFFDNLAKSYLLEIDYDRFGSTANCTVKGVCNCSCNCTKNKSMLHAHALNTNSKHLFGANGDVCECNCGCSGNCAEGTCNCHCNDEKYIPTIYQGENIKIKVYHKGGDNIANAIYNRDSDVVVNNISYPFFNESGNVVIKHTRDDDVTPGNVPDYNEVYQYPFENNQIIRIEVYDENGTLVKDVTYDEIPRTDIYGATYLTLGNDLKVGNYTVKAFYDKSTYYTSIDNMNVFRVIPPVINLVEKVTLNESVLLGDEVEFVIIVNNSNTFALHNVTITEIFNSTELQFIGYTNHDKWETKDNKTFVYKGALDANQTANFTVKFKTLKLGTLVNTVNLTSNETGNKTFTASDKTNVIKLLDKITVNETVFVGDNVEFVVVVTNQGISNGTNASNNKTIYLKLHNVTITEIFNSDELQFVNYTNQDKWETKDNKTFVYKGVLDVNESAQFTITFKTLKQGVFVNTVNLTTNETGSRIINASNKTTVLKLLDKITVNKTVILGDNVSFIIVVNNTNNITLHNVTVTEIFNSAELQFVNYTNQDKWKTEDNKTFIYKGELGVNECVNFTITFKTLTNKTIINKVNLTTNETGSSIATANNTTTVYSPNVSVSKVSLNVTDFVVVGDVVAFNITVT